MSLDVEKLGRQRPAVFSTALAECLFCFSLLMTSMMAEYFVSGFNIVLPAISASIDIPPEARTWPASVFNLVTGSFLLPFGRLADIYGGHVVYVCGLAWLLVWCLVAGFSSNVAMLIAARAVAGLGPAAFLPASIMLLGNAYRPGPRKNLVFCLYGACAPLGFFLGIIMGGLTSQLLSWRWYFFLGVIILGLVVAVSVFFVPRDEHSSENRPQMDYLGTAAIVASLGLLVFAITYGAHAPAGWATPYVPVTLVLGALLLAAAVYVEGWVAAEPLLPFDMFRPKYMVRMVVALFFCYGAFGTFLLYSSFYIQEILGMPPLLSAVWYAPMAVGGIVLATLGGLTMHLLPGRALLILAGAGGVAQMLFFALAPGPGGNTTVTFWAFVFPAMIGATLNIDVTYNVTNVFITTNVPRHRQGAAGAVIFSLLFLGTSFFLGLADLAVAENRWRGDEAAYRVAFWFGTAVGAVALVLFATIRIGSAKSQLRVEEREAESSQAETSRTEETMVQQA